MDLAVRRKPFSFTRMYNPLLLLHLSLTHCSFVGADAMWTLAMAVNVYLAFYHRFDAQRLRKMELPYLIFCYGTPFLPAFIFFFIKNGDGVRVYGSAVQWCWITPEYDILRIATFYGPIW